MKLAPRELESSLIGKGLSEFAEYAYTGFSTKRVLIRVKPKKLHTQSSSTIKPKGSLAAQLREACLRDSQDPEYLREIAAWDVTVGDGLQEGDR